jgi:hypothetical protein
MKPQSKMNLIVDRFSFGVCKTRAPLPKETIAFLRENMEQYKEDIQRGEAYKSKTTKMFGGKE